MLSPIIRICLDIDDVLNNLTMYILHTIGCSVGPADFHCYDPAWGYNIALAATNLHPHRSFTNQTLWKEVSRKVWASAPRSAIFWDLLDCCAALVGRSNICLVTKPTCDPECAAGKIDWIYSNCPGWLHDQFLIGAQKHFCARGDTLLIDDCEENIKTFVACGGRGLGVPRPWNCWHASDTWKRVEGAFYFLRHWQGDIAGCPYID